MTLPRSAVIAALVTGSLAMGFSTAHAQPAAAPKETVNYAVQLLEKTVVATINGGTFSIVEKEIAAQEPGTSQEEPVAGEAAGEPIAEGATAEADKADVQKVVEIKDKAGALVASMPLEFTANGVEIPVASEVKKDGAVLEITPEQPAGVPAGAQDTVLQPVAMPQVVKPIASPAENQMAISEFSSNFGLATAIGGFIGTAVGFVVGCVVIPALGCIPGAGIGGIIGTIAVGGPTLIGAGVELVNTLQAPAGASKWANGGQPQTEPAKAEAEVEAPK
ncbi:hypothetical protein [Nocardia sp. NPDC024068]|uniref:hypothetical protein n=1 Tax=Nocardia sp. NPDC024068 TaxID=3157197 RepID=UPI0033C81CCA